ncbi:hypothetical protein ABES02_15825 [Neobacillus pocheonensis]|uniref:hypothetical protein n=1 Tax=Neobacillus pocheonensis TaxID=363869 RepID=UPI003D276642
MKKLKRNSLPFFILLLIHTCLLGFTIQKSKNRKKIFVLLFANMGFAYLFEYFIFNLFKAYSYKPKIVTKRIFDNIFGAFLSQAIYVPFTAVFLTRKKCGWGSKIASGIYFYLVEKVFLNLGIFKLSGWKSIYTLILLPFYFKLSDFWFASLNKKTSIVRFLSLFFMIMVTETNLFLILAFLRRLRMGRGRYHSWREHFILSPLYTILISLFTAIILRKRNVFGVKLGVVLFAAFLNKLFVKLKILKNTLHPIAYYAIRSIMIFVYGQYREWVYEDEMIDSLEKKNNQ